MKCAICALPQELKEYTEDLIREERSYASIAQEISGQGRGSISIASILRHRARHMKEEETAIGVQTSLSAYDQYRKVDFDKMYKVLMKRASSCHSLIAQAEKTQAFLQIALEDIVCLQAMLISDRLSQHSEGIGPYPHDQMKSLTRTYSMLSDLPAYKNASIQEKVTPYLIRG